MAKNLVWVKTARRGLMRRRQVIVVVQASNGEPLMRTTETYNNKKEAIEAFESVVNNPYEIVLDL